MIALAEPWIGCLKRRSQATVRLLCFPHAGGSAFTFAPWVHELESLAPQVELWTLQLPAGPFAAFDEVAASLTDALLATFADAPVPMVLFGHSLGGLLAFGVARALRARGDTSLLGLMTASTAAPQTEHPDRGPSGKNWSRDDWRAYLRTMGGTSDEVLDDPAQLDEMVGELVHELALRRSFRYTAQDPLAVPVAVHGGVDDGIAADLLAWSEQTCAELTLRLWPGAHFFVHEPAQRARVLRALASDLERWI